MSRTTRQQIAHLLRRAGFGANAADLDHYTSLGFEGAVDELINYQKVDDSALENTVANMRVSNPASANEQHPEYGNPALEVAIWHIRMLLTKRPFQEKMTFFWHGFLTSSMRDVKYASFMLEQNNLYRANALAASYSDLVKALARNPAMLVYLDNNTNVKGAPNENWARELMELFTLGIGNYSEQDVKESARAFTGWSVNFDTGKFEFKANKHDSDSKTFLGVTGNLDGDDIINIIFRQPVHATFIARKVLRFFVYDTPDDPTVARFADIYAKSGFSIKELMTQVLLSPEFRSDRAFYSIVKSPVEFSIGAMRALSLNLTDLKKWSLYGAEMANMGQQIYDPPNVGGWPSNTAWCNSSAYFARAELTRQLLGFDNELTVDPNEIAIANNLTQPSQAVNYFLDLLVQNEVPADYGLILMNFTGDFRNAKDMNSKLRGLVRLIMATPVYQMN